MSRNLYLLWNEASVVLWLVVGLLAWRVPRLAGRLWLALAFLLLAAGALWRVLAVGHQLPEDAPPEMGHWLHFAALASFLAAGIRAAFPGGATAGQDAPEAGSSPHGNPLLAGLPLVLGVAALVVVGFLTQLKHSSEKAFLETEKSLDPRWEREREAPGMEPRPEEPVAPPPDLDLTPFGPGAVPPALSPPPKDLLEQALKQYDEAQDNTGTDAAERRKTAATLRQLAPTLAALGEAERARKACDDAVALLAKLAEDAPDDADVRADLAAAYRVQGGVLAAAGQKEDAEAAYDRAQELAEKLVQDHPDTAAYRKELARLAASRGEFQARQDNRAAAQDSLERARALWEKLVADDADNAEARAGLGTALADLGSLRLRAGEAEPAQALLKDAVEHLQIAGKAAPDNREYRQALRAGEAGLAEALLQRGDYAEAEKVAADLPQAVEDEALGYFLAARVLARCAVLAEKDSQPTEARDDADGALRRLREAVEHGFRDADRLRTDPAFESLRQGDDFRDLVSDLEAKRREEP